MQIDPYLYFDGCCEDAIHFYHSALGAEAHGMLRFKDGPTDDPSYSFPPAHAEKILHVYLRIGRSTVMASDGHCQNKPNFHGFSLSLTAENADEANRWFNALADGGSVQMPLAATFFALHFGMVTDRFGVNWAVVVPKP